MALRAMSGEALVRGFAKALGKLMSAAVFGIACALMAFAGSAWADEASKDVSVPRLVAAHAQMFGEGAASAEALSDAKPAGMGARSSLTAADTASACRKKGARVATASDNATKVLPQAGRLADGVYLVKPRALPGKALGVEGSSRKQKAHIVADEMGGGYAQMFYFKRGGSDGRYAVFSLHSGLALTASSKGLVQSGYKGTPNQRFKVVRKSGGAYALVAKSGGTIAVAGASLPAVMAKAKPTSAQRFRLVPAPLVVPGIYELRSSKYTSQVAAPKSVSAKAGVAVRLNDKAAGVGKMALARTDEGYALRPLGSGAYLTASGGKVKQRASEFSWSASFATAGKRRGIVFTAPNGKSIMAKGAGKALALAKGKGRPEAFLPEETPIVDEGTYIFAAPATGVLGVKGGTYENDGAIRVAGRDGTSAQYFKVEKRDGAYVITSPRTFRSLTSAKGNVVQKGYKGAASQQWRVFVDAQGRIAFQNKASGKVLATVGATKRGKANVGTAAFGSAGAGWALVPRKDYSLTGRADLDKAVASILEDHGSLSKAFWYVADNYRFGGGWRLFNFGDVLSDEELADYAWYMYSNGHGNCYRYAALFCVLARGLDYDANVRIGYLRTTEQAHGWVEVEDHGTKVYDAEVSGAYADIGFVVDGIPYERANAIAASFGENGYNF